jgi:hypothetical protein
MSHFDALLLCNAQTHLSSLCIIAIYQFLKWDMILIIGRGGRLKRAKMEETEDFFSGMGIEILSTKE